MNTLEEAILFAVKVHEGQMRKHSGIPYVTHPISVLRMVTNLFVADKYTKIAAVLHDVVEDTHVRINVIENLFGTKIAGVVSQLTKPDKVSGSEEYFGEVVPKYSDEALMIKFCDRYINIEDFIYDKPSYAPKYAMKGRPIFKEAIQRFGDEYYFYVEQLEQSMELEPGTLYKESE